MHSAGLSADEWNQVRRARPRKNNLMNTSYIVPATLCGALRESPSRSSPRRRAFLFDLGCSGNPIASPPPPPPPPITKAAQAQEAEWLKQLGERHYQRVGNCAELKPRGFDLTMKRRGCIAASRAGLATTPDRNASSPASPQTSAAARPARRAATSRRDHELRHVETGIAGGHAVLDGELQKSSSAGKEPGIAFSSLGFFTQMYEHHSCVRFDGIYAWEAAPLNHDHWWRSVPVDIGARLHLYNLPARLDTRPPAATDEPSPSESRRRASGSAFASVSEPLAVLRSVARPEDFVAMKVDIDGGPEIELVERIAQEPALYELVDELVRDDRSGSNSTPTALHLALTSPTHDIPTHMSGWRFA